MTQPPTLRDNEVQTPIGLLWVSARSFVLAEGGCVFRWRGRYWRHKPGGRTDGMSSPQFTHVLKDAEPFGWAFPEACAHDGGYHGDLELWNDETAQWQAWGLSKDECDQMFLDLLLFGATDEKARLEAFAFYEAVRTGGAKSYSDGHRR